MTDKEIIEQLQQDKYGAAINGLYHILPPVKKYILANNGTAHDAQDIFQEALVVLYKKIQAGNFMLTVSLKTYLLAIVKNCWLQELRLRKKIPVVDTDKDFSIEEPVEEPAFTLAEAAFNALGEKCKQLLIMFYFNKKNYKMIAADMSFGDEKTAKNQKYRCLQKAKENYITLSKNGGHE
jgi:RNA polymerase sigma factor (sigma-70 family)